MSASTVAQNLAAAQQLPINRLDAQLLMLHVLGRTAHERAWLLAHDNDPLDASLHAVFVGLAARRAAGEPLAYLTGFRAFYGLQVAVSPDVLIPRPDTETLVDWALALLALATPEVPPNAAKPETPRVLDLGTGSGAIALALKHQLPNAQVTATDFSLPALAMAQANAARLGLDIHFLHSNWLAGLQASQISHISPGSPVDPLGQNRQTAHLQAHNSQPQPFDLIVSNPPYIVEGDAHLPALQHEPPCALTSGADGLDDIRQIIAQAPAHLRPGGWLLLEHGFDQAGAVRALLAQAGYTQVQSRCDLNRMERCSGGQRCP